MADRRFAGKRGNLIVRFPRPSEFSQLQNLGQHQRDLIDQPQDVIGWH
jgi:hypothetical protein